MLKVYYLSQVSSHKDLQAGVLAGKAGFTYLLCFDNTFSRFRAKTVIYSVIRETGAEGDNLGKLGWTKMIFE